MKMNTELLTDYLNEQCDEQNKKKIEEWIQNDPNNKRYFEELQFYWNTKTVNKTEFDTEIALEKLRLKKAKTRSFKLRRLMRYAAAITILIAGSITSFYVLSPDFDRISISNNQLIEKEISLPDGSVIHLAQGGTISYSKDFSEKERSIKLSGEAFFDVAKDKNRPFTITTNHTMTRVVGTSFRIKEQLNQTNIEVHSGIVEFIDGNDRQNKVKLTKGESALFFDNLKVILKGSDEIQNDQFKIKYLIYQNEKLDVICKDLSELFNTDIRLGSNELKTLNLTGQFENQDLDHILEIISFSLDLDIEKNKDHILLK